MKKDATEIGRYLLACVYRLDEKYNQSFTEDVIIGVIKGKKERFRSDFSFFGWGEDITEYYLQKFFYELKNLNFICIDDDKKINMSGNDHHYKLTPSGLAWLIDKRRSRLFAVASEQKKIKRTPRSKILRSKGFADPEVIKRLAAQQANAKKRPKRGFDYHEATRQMRRGR